MNSRKEKYFKQLMSKSKLEMPDKNFEDKMMSKIEAEIMMKKMPSSIKVGWVLILVTAVLGILASYLLAGVEFTIFNIQISNLKLLLELALTVFILSQIDTMIKFTKNTRELNSLKSVIFRNDSKGAI